MLERDSEKQDDAKKITVKIFFIFSSKEEELMMNGEKS